MNFMKENLSFIEFTQKMRNIYVDMENRLKASNEKIKCVKEKQMLTLKKLIPWNKKALQIRVKLF